MSQQVVLEIKDGVLKCDWWTPEIRDIFCSMCSKKGTDDCDKMTCQIANPYCG